MAAVAKELRERTHVSLNLETRKQEKDALDATRLDIENQLRESHGRPLLASLDELFAASSESSPDENNVEQSEPGESGGYAPEEGVDAVSPADETEFEDPFVTEAMRILADYEALSKRVLALRDEED